MRGRIKTIDVDAYEWFDKHYGNSYFAGEVTINFGTKSQIGFNMPFQYGYGSSYQDEAWRQLMMRKFIKGDGCYSLERYCRENNIILRATKHENCLKRDLRRFEND